MKFSISMMTLVFFAACGSAPVGSPTVRVVPGFRGDARRSFDGVSAESRQFRIAISGKSSDELRDILIIRQPVSGVWWWVPLTVEDPAHSGAAIEGFPGNGPGRVTVGSDAISFFMIAGDSALYVRLSDSRATSLNAAEQHVLQIIRQNPSEAVDVNTAFRIVNFAKAVGADFNFQPGSAFIPPAKLIRVVRAGGRWVVTVKGPNGDSADLTFDDNYHLLTARKYR